MPDRPIQLGRSGSVCVGLDELQQLSTNELVGALTQAVGAGGITSHLQTQIASWQQQIGCIREAVTKLPNIDRQWQFIFEFDIPRRGKRIDVVVLAGELIVVLEFKVGAATASASSMRQVEDYALELADFHKASHGKTIIPAVVPTAATLSPRWPVDLNEGFVQEVLQVSGANLAKFFNWIACHADQSKSQVKDHHWAQSPYRPTPTILEAAQLLYSKHDVAAITRSDANAINLSATQQALHLAIEHAQTSPCKVVCFVTGVPGAGKTLAGLNAVHQATSTMVQSGAVFISGNGPLVKLLVESLARDHHARDGSVSLAKARHESATFVQNMHRYIVNYEQRDKDRPPPERIVVFDEAQRAWNAEQANHKFKRPTSEPVSMLSIMDRHPKWAVLICLIGGGQEIHTGEAGLREWGLALERKFQHWQVRVSPQLLAGDSSTAGQTLFPREPSDIDLVKDPALHLSVPLRSYRSQLVGEWVNAVLNFEPDQVVHLREALENFPIVITRELGRAKSWLRQQRRGMRRAGLVCSSGARRLRPWGIDPTLNIGVEHWFLAGQHDVRSSDFLELAATEFTVQGLELDWAGLCWDADLRVSEDGTGWEHWRFVGTRWNRVRQEAARQFLLNKYRVLLTRAREGLVIWVPRGDHDDLTRSHRYYDSTAQYLLDCGARSLDV